MSHSSPSGTVARERTAANLRDLIAALDRRLPRTDRGVERRVAREAASLRRQAETRLAHLAVRGCS